jgi:hypothetical protein
MKYLVLITSSECVKWLPSFGHFKMFKKKEDAIKFAKNLPAGTFNGVSSVEIIDIDDENSKIKIY